MATISSSLCFLFSLQIPLSLALSSDLTLAVISTTFSNLDIGLYHCLTLLKTFIFLFSLNFITTSPTFSLYISLKNLYLYLFFSPSLVLLIFLTISPNIITPITHFTITHPSSLLLSCNHIGPLSSSRQILCFAARSFVLIY